MATYYTHIIEEGNESLREYALRCATGFCITNRDSNSNEPVRYEEKDSYYTGCLKEAEEDLAKINKMTDKEFLAEFEAYVEEKRQSELEYYHKRMEEFRRYQTMKAKVEALTMEPPYAELKQFMLSQIVMSNPQTEEEIIQEGRRAVEAIDALVFWTWKERKIADADADVVRYTSGVQQEKELANPGNAWIDGLYTLLENVE